ncbi:MAG: hypothetical protein G8237_00505 [Magnetococcales bacterium]|nr:hypothetical protein [Magnetococcales bacterium]NGZ04820.1 hypothetical protein [Magnetococcales bacterium]
MTMTPASLEAEWNQNLHKRQRRSPGDVVTLLLRLLAARPDEAFYQLLALRPHQFWQRRQFDRHRVPMLVFAWRQAVLSTHPAQLERCMAVLRLHIGELPGMNRSRQEIFWNDLTFFQVITDTFAEDGFMSVALHVTQRVLGEIEKKPDNLDWAIGLGYWLDEQYQADREQLGMVEIVTG